MQTKKYTATEQAENISKLIAILHTFTPDQLADFASRKNIDIEFARKWLSPNLA